MPADLIQFQNVARIVTEGVEAEASYRDSRGWYAFGGGAYSRVGAGAVTGHPRLRCGVANAARGRARPASRPRSCSGYRAPVDRGRCYLGGAPDAARCERRPAARIHRAWIGWNATIYVPNVRGFDVTVGIRNILGKRDQVRDADYDRTTVTPNVVILTVPGEGREVYAKVGYSY